MFRNVPKCSGMFHVPAFIDAHNKLQDDAAPDYNYKKKHYCNSYNKKRFM